MIDVEFLGGSLLVLSSGENIVLHTEKKWR